MKISETIKKLRWELRMTQGQFAAELGIKSQSLVSEYEKGVKTPSLQVAKKIIELAKSKKIKINLDSLFGD